MSKWQLNKNIKVWFQFSVFRGGLTYYYTDLSFPFQPDCQGCQLKKKHELLSESRISTKHKNTNRFFVFFFFFLPSPAFFQFKRSHLWINFHKMTQLQTTSIEERSLWSSRPHRVTLHILDLKKAVLELTSEAWSDWPSAHNASLFSAYPSRNWTSVDIHSVENSLLFPFMRNSSQSVTVAGCMTHIQSSHFAPGEKPLKSDTFPRKLLCAPHHTEPLCICFSFSALLSSGKTNKECIHPSLSNFYFFLSFFDMSNNKKCIP